MANIRLGFISLESGQTPFYPQRLQRSTDRSGNDLLSFYATKLSTMEMTRTNYRIPSEVEAKSYADSLPEGFVMHVKIFGLFSFGSCPVDALPSSAQSLLNPACRDKVCKLKSMNREAVEEVWHCFRQALEPLRQQGKLGLVMSQFTNRFLPNDESFEYLREVCKQIAPARLAAEFRHPSWGKCPKADEILEELCIVPVLTDDNGSHNYNNNFREMINRVRGREVGYCRIHRRPRNRETGLICENVTKDDIEASMQVDVSTGLSLGDLRPGEVLEWCSLLRQAKDVMKPGACIYVLFSTIGRNASADNVQRFNSELGELVHPWPRAVIDARTSPEECLQQNYLSPSNGDSVDTSCIICGGCHSATCCESLPMGFWDAVPVLDESKGKPLSSQIDADTEISSLPPQSTMRMNRWTRRSKS